MAADAKALRIPVILAALIVLLVGAQFVAGRGGSYGRTYVDGYPIGDRVCPLPGEEWLCQGYEATARSSLDDADRGHAQVRSVDIFNPDFRDAEGAKVGLTLGTSGGEAVVVLGLADATVRAFLIGCSAGPSDFSPESVHCAKTGPLDWQT